MPKIVFQKNLPDKFLTFWQFLNKQKIRKINFFLLIAIFLLFPTQNYYAKLNINAGRPVVRDVDIQLPEVKEYPQNINGVSPPTLSARAALVIDVPSKTIIFAKNPDEKLFPASTTKIMTALVTLQHYNLDDVLEVKTINDIGMTIKLEKGEKLTVENLLYGMLVGSGNDAAYTLAENYPGGVTVFLNKMNEKATQLNLLGTFFQNVTGLESWEHLTTAHDLAVLTAEALKNKTFTKIVSTYKITIVDITGEHLHELENVNKLLGQDIGIKGVKTGWTENAGECLVAYIERNNKQILTVVLGSNDRFGETVQLADWVLNGNFIWGKVTESTY